MKHSTKDEFIKKSLIVHGNKYNYEHVVYKNSTTKVLIKCVKHGIFSQTPHDHLQGKGCPICSGRCRHTLESFIKAARKKHGDKYNYDQVVYVNNKTDVKIYCKKHGLFSQTPNEHLSGCGCKKCAIESSRLTKEEFVTRSKKLFNDYYNYNKVVYKNNHTKVKIICPIHGEFMQTPQTHLQGCGCIKCANKNQTNSTADFIKLAKEKHGNIYDYSKTKYINCKSNVIITCKKHGDFKQRPSAHLFGAGCPVCKQSHGEQEIRNYLNKTGVLYETQYKIKDCKFKNYLPFDFAIFNSDKTLRCLIEYQGQQHFKEVKLFDKKKGSFAKRKLRDAIKKDFCMRNGIQFLEVSYLQDMDSFFDEAGGLLWK